MFPSGSRLGLFHFVLKEKCYLSEQLQARRHPSCLHEAVVALKLSAVLRGLGGLWGWALSRQPLKARASLCQSPASRQTLQFRAPAGPARGEERVLWASRREPNQAEGSFRWYHPTHVMAMACCKPYDSRQGKPWGPVTHLRLPPKSVALQDWKSH